MKMAIQTVCVLIFFHSIVASETLMGDF